MKYYTKDWYKEMGINGFLYFPDTKEEWDETINDFKSLGRDLQKNLKEDLEFWKNDLIKFLPKSFHPYIHDGTLNTEYPSEELRKMIDKWKNEYIKEWKI